MKWPLLAAALLVSGCATTGNPREGGLFGWSETKARERIAERRAENASADAALAREQRRGANANGRMQALAREETATARQRDQASAALTQREENVSAKTAHLVAESPTPATASRARRLQLAVEATRRDSSLSPTARARELHRLENEIDQANANLRR